MVGRPAEALWVMLFGAIPSYWPWIFNCRSALPRSGAAAKFHTRPNLFPAKHLGTNIRPKDWEILRILEFGQISEREQFITKLIIRGWVVIDTCHSGYSGYSEVSGYSGVNVCGWGGEERSPTNNKGGHPTAQTFLTPMNMQHIDVFDNVF